MSSIDIKTEANLLILSVTGEMLTAEVIAVINEYYPNNIIYDVIWDFTNGSLISASQNDFHSIAKAVKKSVSAGARKGGKTVFVGSINVEYGLLRMYTTIADMNGVPTTYNVFRTLEEARRWIKHDQPFSTDNGDQNEQ